MARACIQKHNGEPSIIVDGKPYPPMAMTVSMKKPDYLRHLGESGIKIYFLMCNTDWLEPGGEFTDESGNRSSAPSGTERFCRQAETLLAAVPDAYIIVRIGLHPPLDWIERHRDDLMQYNDGSLKPTIVASEVHKQHLPGMYSLCSDAWRQDGAEALQEFFDTIDRTPYAGRVIGYFLAAGGTSEWYPCNPLTDYANHLYGDFSPAFRREYERILREKYGTEEALRRAWRKPDATFAAPIIPPLEERVHTRIDDKILDAMLNFESAERTIGKKIELNPADQTNIGVFLNADRFQHVADFYHAWHRGVANTIIHFARVVRRRYADTKLVGAFYGSYGCTDYYDLATAEATLPILDSGLLDFLAAPGVYNNREPGGYVAQREMQDSFRLRNQIYVVEEDSRTHLENDFYRDSMGLYDIADTIHTLKRDFARNLCEDIYAWWFDQHPDGGRYEHPDIYALFKRQQEIAAYAYSIPREKHNEIALIFDQESLHYVSQNTSSLMLDLYRTSDLARIGAPVDYYFHDDLARPDMPDYKLYVMINTFVLTDAERQAITAKLTRNNAVAVWLYAPGFINPDAEQRIGNANIEELIGMKIKRIDRTCSPRFKITDPAHPALSLADPDRRYGYIDRDVHSNVWLGNVLPPPYMYPGFLIDDPEVEALGRYLNFDGVALGLKVQPAGWTSIYCAPQILRSELLAGFARYAGCHLYTHTDDCLYANDNFVTIHAKTTGKRTLYFPWPCNPYEVYEKRFYGHNITELEVDMRLGETLMFLLKK
ncbi:hypothetical protein [Victivallis sp. Marseille-Q1083]|uniref:hypothetical protein n=1 Tax=Victivallis sp. Marseille-Q1083 TaxID=2717288 RepID=UPI00158BC17A|nr:hypothetical protein [Victivallis sp. Marseille-Q1083]